MKIAVISTSAIETPPQEMRYAGIEVVVWNFARAASMQGNEVTLITTNESPNIGTFDVLKEGTNEKMGSLAVVGAGPTGWHPKDEQVMYQGYKNWLEQQFGQGQGIVWDNSWWGFPYLSARQFPNMKLIHSHHGMCFVKGTPVLTDKGMKDIDSLVIGDTVLGHDGKYHKILRTFSRPVDEELYRIKAVGSPDIVVTSEHPILGVKSQLGGCAAKSICTPLCVRKERGGSFTWYRTSQWTGERLIHTTSVCNEIYKSYNDEWIKANELQVGDYVVQAAPMGLKYHLDISDSLLRLIGWYLAEGSTVIKNGYYVRFHLSKDETREIEEIVEDLKTLGLNPSVSHRARGHPVICVGSKEFTLFITENFGRGSMHKYIPSWLINAEKRQVNLVLNSMFRGDGYAYKDGRTAYATISPSLAIGVRMMCSRHGITCYIVKEKPRARKFPNCKNISECQPLYRLRIASDEDAVKEKRYNFFSDGKLYSRIKSIVKEHYKGDVFDIQVEDSSSFTVFSCSVHNSSWMVGTPQGPRYMKPPVPFPRMLGVSSQHAQHLANNFGCPVRYVHNGIDLPPFDPNTAKSEDFLLSLNRISQEKGIVNNIDVAMQTGWKMKVVGDDIHPTNFDYINDVQNRCANSGGQIQYYGHVDNETKWDLLRRCKALIACTDNEHYLEAFGIYAVEANAVGKPVLGTANGGLYDIIKRDADGAYKTNGLLATNTAGVISAIRNGALDTFKPENCRAQSELYSTGTMTVNYLQLFEKVLRDDVDCRW